MTSIDLTDDEVKQKVHAYGLLKALQDPEFVKIYKRIDEVQSEAELYREMLAYILEQEETTEPVYYCLEWMQWGHFFEDQIDLSEYITRSQDFEELEKEKQRIVDDILASFEDHEIVDLLPKIGVGYAVRTFWEQIKDKMQAIVCDDVELYTALLECIIEDDLCIVDNSTDENES